MKKIGENRFIEKFRLLNSQETNNEISWSCSDSSEYDDHIKCDTGKVTSTSSKRKRAIKKKNESMNVSNLEIKFVETIPERIRDKPREKSPILLGKSRSELLQTSPILTPSQCIITHLPAYRTANTHIVNKNSEVSTENRLRSPIIPPKRESTKVIPKVRKKLFENCRILKTNDSKAVLPKTTRSTSPIFSNKKNNDFLRHGTCFTHKGVKKNKCVKNLNKSNPFIDITEEINKCLNKEPKPLILKNIQKNAKDKIENCIVDNSSEDNESSTKKSHSELVARVKSYFDSYFSSQGSQHSISECETSTPNSSNNNEEIDITNPMTQVRSLTPSLKEQISSFDTEIDVKSKKVKYKKGGLAYRLDCLLKKQNASVSLWQHERFLAANSSFVIPKAEFLALRIKCVDFKYNIYLIEAIDSNEKQFLIIINSILVNNVSFEIDDVLKIYEPYKIIDANNNCEIVTNICKFEIGKLKF